MLYRKLNNLFQSSDFALPYIEANDAYSYLHFFKLKMQDYLKALNYITQNDLGTQNKRKFIDRIESIIVGFEAVLFEYLDGIPAKAYSRFEEIIKLNNLATELICYRVVTLDPGYKLYRTRTISSEDASKYASGANGFQGYLKNMDLFHISFEERKKVSTNRFSIPGFPCLYVSDSLMASWSECLEDGEPFHAISFSTHRPLYIADLSPINFLEKSKLLSDSENPFEQLSSKDILTDYATLYPLIFACHSKIRYNDIRATKFKSEYIVPQLLMQWYRQNRVMIDGIRYLSCTAFDRFPNIDFKKFNYVIPVIDCNETGYCSCLMNNFASTPVYSYLTVDKSRSSDLIVDEIQQNLVAATMFPLLIK